MDLAFPSSTSHRQTDSVRWPIFLEALILTPRHRERLLERASAIGDLQMVANLLDQANGTDAIRTLQDLKVALDRIEAGRKREGTRTVTAEVSNVVFLPYADAASAETITQQQVARSKSRQVASAVASAEAAVRQEIRDKRLPMGKDANLAIMRATLGMRRRGGQ